MGGVRKNAQQRGSHEARRMIDAARTAVGRLASLLQ
jgi:ribosomal protein L13